MESSDSWDVIVIGAGLAGLASAHEACKRGKRVLVLEAREQPGGKVVTRRWKGINYELGALFAFKKEWMPFPVEAGESLTEDHPIGVFHDGRLISGQSVGACLQAAGMGARELLSLTALLQCSRPQPAQIGETPLELLNAFFRVIHPGRLEDYVPRRRLDSLVRHPTSHYAAGNGALIDALLENTSAEIRCGCRVEALVPDRTGVAVHWQTGGRREAARTDWLILATPAAEAGALAEKSATASGDFLRRIRYGQGIVAVLGLTAPFPHPHSYIVCPAGPVNTFFFHHHTGEPGLHIVTAYLVGEAASAHQAKPDNRLIEIVLSQLDAMCPGVVNSDSVEFSEVLHWPAVGPVIEMRAYEGFCKACLRPFGRVVLAGDYTWWNGDQMPYGMEAALASGQRAASMAIDQPRTAPTTAFRPAPLAVSTMTRLTDSGPAPIGHFEDGTVAFYGLVLKAEPDTDLERYLAGECEDGLWSYQQDYGVTSLDSALVMEGLLSTGRHTDLLNYSADRLVEEFFDPDEGGFRTLPRDGKGRAAYWRGVDCPATAFCGWLLRQIAPQRHAEVIAACASYLKRKQKITGRWPGKWFPSEVLPLFYAVRFLALSGPDFRESCERAGLWLRSLQGLNGSWEESVIGSSAAVLALHTLGKHEEAVRDGCRWIRSQRAGGSWPGEPILQYWFEEAGQRIFFHTRDKGRITTSWARLALSEVERGNHERAEAEGSY